MKQIVQVFKSPKKEGAYLYMAMNAKTSTLPEALIKLFGVPQLAMKIAVSEDKKLAYTTGDKVLAAISEQGFYLQLPKPENDDMAMIANKNSKLPRHG